MQSMNVYQNYLPVLIFIIVAIVVSTLIAIAGRILSKITGAYQPSEAKNSPFECGFPEFEDARSKFDVRFYLVALLFLIFDLEVAFLFPWGIQLKSGIGTIPFVAMMIFLVVLFIGLIYEWKKGALEWE